MARLRLYRCMLLWMAPSLFIVVVPLYMQVYNDSHLHSGEQAGSLDTITPFLILVTFAAASCAVDRCVQSPVLLIIVCVSQLVVFLTVLDAPADSENENSESNSHVLLSPSLRESLSEIGKYTHRNQSGSGKISVVLSCADDGYYSFNTVMSFCNHTPADVLHEVIVVDDGSDPPLDEFLKEVDKQCPLRLLRKRDTMGMIIAKQTGGDAALGEFIGFFDCQVAPSKGWHTEIIQLLRVSPRRLVVPTITELNLDTWDEQPKSQANSKCYLDWNGEPMWFDDNSDYIPIVSSGPVAISRHWWNMSGGLDTGMSGGSGENVDQSLRTWLCGGDIVRARTSHVARVPWDKRTQKHYNQALLSEWQQHDNNRARVAQAWFDDFSVKYQDRQVRQSRLDVSSVLERKQALSCKPFAYFLHRFRKVYMTSGVLPTSAFKLRATSRAGDAEKLCVHRQGKDYGLSTCDVASIFHLANQDPSKAGECCSGIRQWNSLDCFDRLDARGPLPAACDVTGHNKNQEWTIHVDGRIKNGAGRCLTVSRHENGGLPTLMGSKCEYAVRWEQVDKFLPLETKLYRDAVNKYGYTDSMPDD